MTNHSRSVSFARDGSVSLLALTVSTSIILSLCAPLSVAVGADNSRRSPARHGSADQQPLPTPSVPLLPSPTPTRTPGDGIRQLTPGSYVPPALRTDNIERRGIGKEGKRVKPPQVKLGSPALNLPDLNESRKTRKSPVTKKTLGVFVAPANDKQLASRSSKSHQRHHNPARVLSAPQEGLLCADCDPSGGGGAGSSAPSDPYFGTARTRPENETGEPGVTLGSRNFNWSLPLVSLPGRAGLDVSISLFYNSLVWTRQGNAIEYNADHGSPAPGFQLGLPRLQAPFFDTDDGSNAYIMVTPSGGRVEMKQIGSTNVYESADSTYTQLTFSGNTPVVRTTDGTQFIFETQVGAEWRCTKIEDRNGNYISASYDSSTGHILSLTDPLGRVLNFQYDANNNLWNISQTWGSQTHSWATFVYTTVQVSFNFPGLTVYGASNGSSQTVLSFVVFPENTSYHFDYNSYGQVYQIRHKAPDGHELEHTFYNMDNPGVQTDCPRFTERHDYAQDWNGNQDAVTSYSVTNGATWTNPETGATESGTLVQQTAPDGTTYKEYSHDSGWDTGLTRLNEFLDANSVRKKWISTTWTQDNTSLTFPQNPRVAEMNIYDDAGNRRRTTIDYSPAAYAQYGLPYFVSEYAANGTTEIRRTYTDYNMSQPYLDRHIIGLPSASYLVDVSNGWQWQSKISYGYDDPARLSAQATAATMHDQSLDVNFTTRGNVTSVTRWDVNDIDNASKALTRSTNYNAAGSSTDAFDAAGHHTSIDYSDNFSDSNANQGTFAYATTVIDPDGYSSSAQYKYEYGAITRTHVPTSGTAANQNATYLDVTREYDEFARLEWVRNLANNSYTHFVYQINANYIQSFQTIIDLNPSNEFYSVQVLDGAGRVRASASDHPGSAGGFTGQFVVYDNMGRVTQQSNPTEITGGWLPTGDDAAGWHATQQSYDWKGRPLQTTNSDGTTRIMSYGGCGCAGGEITTVQDEHGRQRRFTKDALGRLAVVEEMNWNTGNVYAATSYGYNARDQITGINQSGQTRSFDYDGHGRLLHRITPEQGTTTYSYYADDTTHVVTDARNVTTTYGYNNRHQITSLTYNVAGDPTSQTMATANVGFVYDAAGNRTSMSDGQGSANYVYNNLSQMTSETRSFNGLTPTYTLTYDYNLAGELRSVTNPWSAQVSYGYDKAGRLSNVGGAGYAGVTNYASSLSYRAFGAIKGMNYGDGHSLSTGYDSRLRPTTWNVSGVLGYNYAYDYFGEHTGRVTYAHSLTDDTLDRSYEYDLVGRLTVSHSGAEARAHSYSGQWGTLDGPYSQGYDYDVWGNVTHKYGWGGEVQGGTAGQSSDIYYNYIGNRRNSFAYDAAGNVTNDGGQTFQYDATGQQTYASGLGAGWGAPPSFQDNPLVVGQTTVRAVHIAELRTAINALRGHLNLSAYSWTTSATTNDYISANPIIEMRTALDQALGAPSGGYAAGLAQYQPVKAIHIQELRDRVTAAWNAYSASGLSQFYDGDGLRVKKTESGATTFYLRSSVLGGQVLAELDGGGNSARGYVYAGGSLMAVQQGSAVFWTYEDPVTKSKRVCDVNGNIVSTVELDPWGADTNRSGNQAFQPRKYTTYDRDGNGSDEAMFRRYNRKHSRFDQPDPYEGSYNLTNPQSFNRYSYVLDDPVNLIDPSGLECAPKTWGELTQQQQALFKDAQSYTDLKDPWKANFLVTTMDMEKQEIVYSGLSIVPSKDESRYLNGLHFAQATATFIKSVRAGLANGTFSGSVNSARQIATTNSLHVRAGDNPEVHIDSFGATTDLAGFFGHLGEWGIHKLSHLDGGWQRDPFAIARRLGIDICSHSNPTSSHDAGHGLGPYGGGPASGGFLGSGGYPSWWYSMWAFVDWVDSIQIEGQPDWSNEGPVGPKPTTPPKLH